MLKKIRTLHLSLISTVGAAIILSLLIVGAPNSFAASKRIAVLYFDDHSNFDSPTGCGCIPGPIGKIFGGGHKRWNLKAGFTELLNRKLTQTGVYEPVPQSEIISAMARLKLSKKALKKANAKKRELLAKELKADALIVGDIRKFNQERARANASRTLRESSTGRSTTSFVGGVQVLGYVYYASIKLDTKLYGVSGNEVASPQIAVSKRHQLGGAKIASLQAVVTEEGTEFKLGQLPGTKRKFRPIVNPSELNKIAFASPEYDQTLLGIATDEAMVKIVMALRDNIGPNFVLPSEAAAKAQADKEASSQPTAPGGPITGTIIYVDAENPENTYINIGSAAGVKVQQQLTVYTKGEPLTDPDTGDMLGYVPKKIGKVEIVEIRTDRLSRVRIIEGFGEIKKGDKVKLEE